MLTIIEGYEMTGKTTLVKDLIGKIAWTDIAKGFGITTPEGTHGVGYTGSWIIGATVAHLGAMGVDVSNVVLDRGILSSIIYGEMKDKFRDISHLTRYLEDLNKIGCEIVICTHKNKESARKIFEKSKKERQDLKDAYDDDNFDSYWFNYSDFIARVKKSMSIFDNYKNIKLSQHTIEYKDDEPNLNGTAMEEKSMYRVQEVKSSHESICGFIEQLNKCSNTIFATISYTDRYAIVYHYYKRDGQCRTKFYCIELKNKDKIQCEGIALYKGDKFVEYIHHSRV